MSAPARVIAAGLGGSAGGLATAAAVAVSLAAKSDDAGALMIELGEGGHRRGPTMLASAPARALEERLRGEGVEAAARGRLACVVLGADVPWEESLAEILGIAPEAAAVVHAPVSRWRSLLWTPALRLPIALLRADVPAQRSLAALTAIELRAAGVPLRIATRAPGRIAARRALAGIDPGGDAARRAGRIAAFASQGRSRRSAGRRRAAPRLAAETGQALPLVLGGVLALIATALVLTAFGGAVTGRSRAQRAADLAALSAARSMRDDYERLFAPAERPDGSANPVHLDRTEYLSRATASAREAADRNGVAAPRLRIEFPDAASFAPLRVQAEIEASLEVGSSEFEVTASAGAEAVPPSQGGGEQPTMATGGGYSGPLAYRQGKPMRPDVAAAFDRLAAAARADGLALIVNSAYRSDAEQAQLFAANPDPRWVAPPGTSLHRCATELDLGPAGAYGWLAANAARFGFVQRYSWEPWHYGLDDGPAPCSAAGDATGGTSASAGSGESGGGLPSFVPQQFREPIAAAAARWNVGADLLAAQLMAESNFNPFAVSPAGAQGIAQFMPPTAAAYGLDDPFDAARAIDAQAHLMSDLLGQFGAVELALAAYNAGPTPVEACDCVPSIPEAQAYVAHILGLMHGAGAPVEPALEVRLVS